MKITDLKLNEYGNVDGTKGIPKGFFVTDLTTTQLKKIKVDTVKVFTGYVHAKGSHYNPVLKNLVSNYSRTKVENYHEIVASMEQKQKETAANRRLVKSNKNFHSKQKRDETDAYIKVLKSFID